jgi:hypothetical protein
MNPLVKVSAARGPSSDRLADAAFLGGFDLIVAAGGPLRAAAAAGDAAAAAGVKFMAAAVRGAAGFYFVDLGRHTYLPKVGGAAALGAARGARGALLWPFSTSCLGGPC